MMRRKGVLSLTVWTVVVLLFAPSASACVWCDSHQWLNFQNCLYWRIRNEQSFSRISVGALDDMRNSITAASQAITKGSSSMKMKMLVGAMAGEMSELIKPVPSNEGDGRAKTILMNIVKGCNVEVSGRPDLGFIDELGRTLDFMMNEPSYDGPQLLPNDNNALPQNAVQSFTNPVNFNGQNINNPSPDFNNIRQPQLPSAETILNNAAPYRGNNQQAPSGIPFPINQNAGSRFPEQASSNQRDINAASLSYPAQPQITNANGASEFNSFYQNPSINPSVTNANAAISSYSLAQSPEFQQQINRANSDSETEMYQYPTEQAKNTNVNPGSRPNPLNPSSFIQPQITRANAASSANSYNLASTNTFPNTDQNNVQNQFPPRDFFPTNNQVSSYSTNNFLNQQFPAESSINQPQSSFRGSDTKTFDINAQNVPQQNQFIQYPVSNGNGLGQSGAYPLNNIQRQTDQSNVGTSPYNELPQNYDYSIPNQNYPNNPEANVPYGPSSASSVVTNSNSQRSITQGSGNFLSNYPEITNKMPKNGKKFQNRTPDLKLQQKVKNQKSLLLSPNDDDVARAMRFVETFYVLLSQSNDFKSVFNEQMPNDQALSLVYTIDVGALNDCGYSRFSVEIANACTVVIQSLPDGCSFVQYAEALSKALMDQLNMKTLIGENPEDQAKCIANNFLTRLNQKISLVITTTTMQPPLAFDSKSTFFQGPGSQPQVTNANSESYSYSLYQNPDILQKLKTTNGARINRPNTDQFISRNNVQNQFPQGNNVPINNAVPSNLINKPQNQVNFAPGPMNQQDSSATATNKNIRPNPNLQNMDKAYNEDGIKNAAIYFYQKLSYDLLTSSYIRSIYNEETTKTNAKTNTATLLLGSLSADYDNLAIEIARECIRRLSSVQTGSNTEAYTTLISTCITDAFSYYGLISQETPSAQASDISSKIITWLSDTNNGSNNQAANRNIDAQSNSPNQGVIDYPDSFSDVPTLNQWQQPPPSEVLASNSGGNTDYNPYTDNLAPQYLRYDYQNFNSNSPPITNDGLQNIRTSSNANSSSVKTNTNKGKNKNANKSKKRNSKKAKKKKPAVSKTNFNFDNLNNNYPYNYPINNAAKSKPNSPPDISNGNYFRDYNGNLDYQPDNVPNTQSSGFQNYPAQNANQDYDLTAGANKIQNDNISGPQQSALSMALNNSPGRKKCKKLKIKKGKTAADKPLIIDGLGASNYFSNQRGPSALDMANNPQTFQSNEYAGSQNNDYDANPYQNTAPVPFQSQIIPDERNDDVKDRIRYLTKGVLSSMSNGKFDYKSFSDIIADVSKNLQTTHPELGSQTIFIKTLIDSITACTQLLTKVPPNYFDSIGVLQNSDIPDAAAIDYSNSILPLQGEQGTIQTNQNNVALKDQSYGTPTLPQQNNLYDDQTGQRNFHPGDSASLANTNVPQTRQDSGIQSFPQNVGGNGLLKAQTSRGISSQMGQDNSLPSLPNGYGSQNLPFNNQNNLAFQPSGGFNNPNLQPGNMGNQNIQSGNSFQTGLPQANQMYDTNLPQNN